MMWLSPIYTQSKIQIFSVCVHLSAEYFTLCYFGWSQPLYGDEHLEFLKADTGRSKETTGPLPQIGKVF